MFSFISSMFFRLTPYVDPFLSSLCPLMFHSFFSSAPYFFFFYHVYYFVFSHNFKKYFLYLPIFRSSFISPLHRSFKFSFIPRLLFFIFIYFVQLFLPYSFFLTSVLNIIAIFFLFLFSRYMVTTLGHYLDICVLGQGISPSHAPLDSGVTEYIVGLRGQRVRNSWK